MDTLNKLVLAILLLNSSFLFAGNVCRDHGMKHGLFTMKTDGTDLRLVRMLTYPKGYPEINFDKLHVSSDGKKLAYLRCLQDHNDTCQCDYYTGVKEVVISDFDGFNEVVVSKNAGGFNDYPNWSPDDSSLLFMFSEKGKGADLYTYNIATKTRVQLTDTPIVQESDNFWNSNGKVTFVMKDYSMEGTSNFISSAPITEMTQRARLTEPKGDEIRHCCYADPKFSYDQKYFVYSRFEKLNGEEGDWDIMLRSTKDNTEVDLSGNDFMELYPLFSRDSKKIFWTRSDPLRHVTSYIFLDVETGHRSIFDIAGEGVVHSVNGRKVIFGGVKWADWLHPRSDTIIFPATFTYKD